MTPLSRTLSQVRVIPERSKLAELQTLLTYQLEAIASIWNLYKLALNSEF